MNYKLSSLSDRQIVALRVISTISAEIARNKQEKRVMDALKIVCEFYREETREIVQKIKEEKEVQKKEREKSLEEARIRAEKEKRKYYIQKGGGVKIIYLSRQESETIQKIAEALGIEHLEEVGENEDGTEASPSWWGDTTF